MPYAIPVTCDGVGPIMMSHPPPMPHSAFKAPSIPASSHLCDSEPLPSVPRSRPGHKTRLTAPSAPSPNPICAPPVVRSQSHQTSPVVSASSKPKRIRGHRSPTFTTAVVTSSSSNSEDDSDRPKATSGVSEPPKLVTPPIDVSGASLTVGRRAGQDFLRKAASVDTTPPRAISSPMITVESASPAMSSVGSPVADEELQVKRHQAISAGQGGVLRLNMDALQRARSASPSVRSGPPSGDSRSGPTFSSLLSPGPSGRPKYATIGSASASNLVRKKSGELVKPALRPSRTNSSCSSPFLDEEPDFYTASPSSALNQSMMYRRNSAPSTPTPKNVKFDAQLEHVKLFSAEQKPAAVSRDGSPNGYGSTTEEESGYPWSKNNKEKKGDGPIKVRILDGGASCGDTEQPGPNSRCLSSDPDLDVRLESLVWDEEAKSLKGNVIVRNIAFEKRVSARFTLDWWQTTSEVAGRYIRGVACPPPEGCDAPVVDTHDRFAFIIKLSDVLAKIEEKTLFIAIRYSVDGRELWDNNKGRNYHVAFDRIPSLSILPKGNTTALEQVSQGAAKPSDPVADLRRELARVVIDNDADRPCRPVFKQNVGTFNSTRKAVSVH